MADIDFTPDPQEPADGIHFIADPPEPPAALNPTERANFIAQHGAGFAEDPNAAGPAPGQSMVNDAGNAFGGTVGRYTADPLRRMSLHIGHAMGLISDQQLNSHLADIAAEQKVSDAYAASKAGQAGSTLGGAALIAALPGAGPLVDAATAGVGGAVDAAGSLLAPVANAARAAGSFALRGGKALYNHPVQTGVYGDLLLRANDYLHHAKEAKAAVDKAGAVLNEHVFGETAP